MGWLSGGDGRRVTPLAVLVLADGQVEEGGIGGGERDG